MIKSRRDLELIKEKMAPLLALRNANPKFKIVFHYHAAIRHLGVDELIAYTINKLSEIGRLDTVVYRLYDETLTDRIFVSIIEEDKTTKYQHVTKEIVNIILDKHLTRGLILTDHLVSEDNGGNLA